MPLFGRRSKDEEARRPSPDRPPNDPDGMRDASSALAALFEAKATDADGRIRVEDLLSASAAVCGEACIAAAGEIDVEHHGLVPGSRGAVRPDQRDPRRRCARTGAAPR